MRVWGNGPVVEEGLGDLLLGPRPGLVATWAVFLNGRFLRRLSVSQNPLYGTPGSCGRDPDLAFCKTFMPPKPRWLLAIPDAISQLEKLDRTLAATSNGSSASRPPGPRPSGPMTGYQRTLPRTKLLRQLRGPVRLPRRSGTSGSPGRRTPEGAGDRDPGDASRETLDEVGELARGGVGFGRIEVRFGGAKEAVERLYARPMRS